MLKDGKYLAWYRTKHSQGTGVVHLANGTISGGDSFFSYRGSYQLDQPIAVLTIKRFAAGGGLGAFGGLDEIEVALIGERKGAVFVCSGRAKQAPDVAFEVTLIPSQEEAPASEAKPTVVKPGVNKLPKGRDPRARLRNMFGG